MGQVIAFWHCQCVLRLVKVMALNSCCTFNQKPYRTLLKSKHVRRSTPLLDSLLLTDTGVITDADHAHACSSLVAQCVSTQ